MSTTLIWAFVCLIIFVAVLARETSELDDIYLHGSRCFIGKSYGGKRYLCGA